jgi:hypothetical protein
MGCALLPAIPSVATQPVQFNRDIRPLLSDRCFACHGPDAEARQADLRLDVRDAAIESAIVPGQPDESEVWARIISDDPDVRMPPVDSNRPALSPEEAQLVRRWIAAGAPYASHWSYQPLVRPDVPAVEDTHWPRGDVDRFVRADQEAAGVSPAPEAESVVLVRRIYLDLVGLPPTPEQVDQFLQDERPDAYERLVDELLASPHFGERMATWWFDLVRFADTVGYHGDQDHHILPYRDYVIKAFNDNVPFDEFTIAQIAGDLLPEPSMWDLVATGYNRLLQSTHEGGAQDKEYRAKMLSDRVRNLSEVWMGASMGCAECHDHKFDPYAQRDFYRMAAFFADVDHYGSFAGPGGNSLPTARPPEMLAWTLPVYHQAQALDQQIADLQRQLVGKLPGDYPQVQRQLVDLKHRRIELEALYVPTMVTQAIAPAEIRVLARGNWMDESGEVVAPGTPPHLPPLTPRGERADRLDLARWLVSGSHPLTGRTLVNRLWKLCFGRGLSKNLIELGSQGDWPTHPELLDWLAVELVDHGWDLKHLLRLLVTSSAYRQSSLPRDDLRDRDPGNLLWTRQERYRLDAEQIRDVALLASGLLVRDVGGVFGRPYQPAGYYRSLNFPEREYEPSTGDEQFRRGVYTHWQRQFLHPALKAFDAPSREECTAQRSVSSTPSAALVLLNDPSYLEAARALASRVLDWQADTPPGEPSAGPGLSEGPSPGDDARLGEAWRRVLSRVPSGEEVDVLAGLLAQSRAQYRQDMSAARQLVSVGITPGPADERVVETAAWTSVCRALLNLNETITRN